MVTTAQTLKRNDVELLCMVWYGMVWYGMVWYGRYPVMVLYIT